MTLRHNKLRDIAGTLLGEIYQDMAIEPLQQAVIDNNVLPSTANTNDDAS